MTTRASSRRDAVQGVVPFVEEPETARRRIEYLARMAELEQQQE